ncbi:hypothetical protein G9P44_000388 [Scheffersomyces stipitis]|nr:hypothetical protein G9P44_000388 [Scheffersomyces stipitis]
MGKRKSGDKGSGGKSKKFKASGFIDPHTTGVYATCNRHKEQACRKELMNLFEEKIGEYFDLENGDNSEDEGQQDEDKELSIEEQIQKELEGLKEVKGTKKELLKPIELDCECLVFIKTRRPIDPEVLVERICQESYESKIKNTRYTQKLTPVTFSVSPTKEELKKLASRVLAPHFHKPEGQEPIKFAIQVSRRNFNAMPKDEIIKSIAESVGRDHGHSVDLKNYDKIILVECYKTSIGMSVANNYLKYDKFNLQQIFEKGVNKDDTNIYSRVGKGTEMKNAKSDKENGEKDSVSVTTTDVEQEK